MQSKIFRLFISSTFSDFAKEREVLQTKVFPYIKDHASKQGYVFQPIDLRWGVNNEAQLDQKTLELCLNEVRECKTHIHPNFLIMLGDRYGWVPCPYAIEKVEFEEILSQVEKNKDLLQEWYRLDENQIPSSYILQQRYGVYEKYEEWEKIETILRDTLQQAVNNSNLNKEQKRKYFLSATESEVEEGIIPYIKPTKFQTEVLLKDNKKLEKDDAKYIFGFLRDIDKTTKIGDKFITTDYDQAQKFKQEVKKTLLKENTLHVKTTQVDKESLDEEYLKEFEKRVTKFLKEKIDEQKKKESKLTSLEIEQLAQERYAKEKIKNFLGREETLSSIQNYLVSDSKEPFVIYGKSGTGKSALMAKAIAIEEAKKTTDKKVIFRFVGATPNSGSSVDVLKSIFAELGVDIRSEKEKRDEKSKQEEKLLSLDQNDKLESFEEFSLRVHDEFLKLKENIVIFIDAIDQLNNQDNFLWLPKNLPSNLKIIISALNDKKNYKDDTEYFEALKTKTDNLYQVPEFSSEKELLEILLKKEDRCVDKYQEKYFLEQYQNVKSPLYVTIASREMKSWKSGDKTQTLSNTQKGIIKEFIENLTTKYHHNEDFVKKTLGYIYASRDGLSESELLQLLSTDEKFIKKVAPEEFHKNKTKELPLVHWSRLEAELKPFFSKKKQDNEELLYFFHREFEDAIKKSKTQKNEHEAIIEATQKLILQNQDKEFDQNRWGKLYATLLATYYLRYEDEEKYKKFSEFLAKKEIKKSWLERCFTYINDIGLYHQERMEIRESIAYLKINYFFTIKLYQKDPSAWTKNYIISLNNLAMSYQNNNQLKEAIELQTKALEITEELYPKDPSVWAELYTTSLNNLALSHQNNHQLKKAIELLKKVLEITEELSQQNPSVWIKYYIRSLNNLAMSYNNNNQPKEAKKLATKALEITEELYQKNPSIWIREYITSLNNLVMSYQNYNQLEKAIKLLKKVLEITEELYQQNPSVWAELYARNLNNLAYSYYNNNKLKEAMRLQIQCLEITEELYQQNPSVWAELYARSLFNLANSYSNNSQLQLKKKAIDLATKALEITEELYRENPSVWAELYTTSLINLATSYKNNNQLEKVTKLEIKALETTEKLYQEDPSVWAELYIMSLNNLAYSLSNNNQLKEAMRLQIQCLEITEKLYQENPSIWAKFYTTSLNNLVRTYYKNGNLDKCLKLLDKNYKVHVEIYGENHPETRQILSNIEIVKGNQPKSSDSEEEMMKQFLEMLQQNSESEEATFKDLLYLSKFIAMKNKEDEISIASFINALGFIEFNDIGKSIFSLEGLNEYENAKQHIEEVKSQPKLPYSEELKKLVKQLKEIFGDNPIGTLR